jgi:hypothetical protein
VEHFEEVMRPLWSNTSSCLALVLTYADCREWTYYAGDALLFVRDLNKILADKQRYPINLESEADSSWSRWEQFSKLRE